MVSDSSKSSVLEELSSEVSSVEMVSDSSAFSVLEETVSDSSSVGVVSESEISSVLEGIASDSSSVGEVSVLLFSSDSENSAVPSLVSGTSVDIVSFVSERSESENSVEIVCSFSVLGSKLSDAAITFTTGPLAQRDAQSNTASHLYKALYNIKSSNFYLCTFRIFITKKSKRFV